MAYTYHLTKEAGLQRSSKNGRSRTQESFFYTVFPKQVEVGPNKPKTFNDPLQGWDDVAYLNSRLRNKIPRLAVERAVRMTFRRRIACF